MQNLQENIQKVPSSKIQKYNVFHTPLHKNTKKMKKKISAEMKYSEYTKLSKLSIFGNLARLGDLVG